jgi:hypothetical protein
VREMRELLVRSYFRQAVAGMNPSLRVLQAKKFCYQSGKRRNKTRYVKISGGR